MADASLGNLKAKISIDATSFDDVQAKAGKFGSSLKGVFGEVAAAAGIAFSFGAAVSLVTDGVKAAQGLQTAERAVGQVFGDSAKQVEAFADTSVKRLGLTKEAALDAVDSIGRMLTGFGIDQSVAAKDSTALTQRIADIASATGKSQGEVTDAVTSGLKGRGAALKVYGVDINTTTQLEMAQTLGMIPATENNQKLTIATEKASIAHQVYAASVKKTGEHSIATQRALVAYQSAQDAVAKAGEAGKLVLTDQQKALIDYQIIMDSTKTTMGDFGQTTADKLQIMQAAVDTAKEKLGEGLLPVVTQFSDWVSQHQGDITNFAAAVGQGLGKAADVMGGVFAWVADHKDDVLHAVEAIGALFAAHKIQTVANSVIGDLKGLFSAGGAIESGASKLLGLFTGGGSSGGAAGSAIDTAVGARVYVTNWMEIASGKANPLPTSAPGGSEGVGGKGGALAGLGVVGAIVGTGLVVSGDKGPEPNRSAFDVAQGQARKAGLSTDESQIWGQISSDTKGWADQAQYGNSMETYNLQTIIKNQSNTAQFSSEIANLYQNHSITTAGQFDNVVSFWNDTVTKSGGIPPTIGEIQAHLDGVVSAAPSVGSSWADMIRSLQGIALSAKQLKNALDQALNPSSAGTTTGGHGALSGMTAAEISALLATAPG